nr:hypothetical protein [Natronococcus pandeyae]
MSSFHTYASSRLELIGTEGMVSIASPFGGVVPHDMVIENGDLRMEYTGPPVDEVREEFDYFSYCVLTDTTPEPDGEDGLTDLRLIEAATSPQRKASESLSSRGEIRESAGRLAGRSRSYCRTELFEDRSLELGRHRW